MCGVKCIMKSMMYKTLRCTMEDKINEQVYDGLDYMKDKFS